jgi:hypothetical protein
MSGPTESNFIFQKLKYNRISSETVPLTSDLKGKLLQTVSASAGFNCLDGTVKYAWVGKCDARLNVFKSIFIRPSKFLYNLL